MKNRIRQKGICDFKDVRIHFRLSTDAGRRGVRLIHGRFLNQKRFGAILKLCRFSYSRDSLPEREERGSHKSQRPIVRWLRVANKRLLQIIAHFTDCRNNRHCSPLASY